MEQEVPLLLPQATNVAGNSKQVISHLTAGSNCLKVLCFPLLARLLQNCSLSREFGSGQMQLSPGTCLDGHGEMAAVLGQFVMFACHAGW